MDNGGAKTGKGYWRSLERLWDSPALDSSLGEEFPPGASHPPEGIDRRRMLQLMGASLALAGMVSCRRPEEKIVPFVIPPEQRIPGIPKHYATSMPLGTSACGLVVESHEGRPTKVEGNELHPASGGSAGIWMQGSILDLYDPDRARRVQRRSEAGAAFQTSSWDDFLAFWRERSQSLQGSGRGLAVLAESYSSPSLFRLSSRFRSRFPEARWVVYEPVGDENIFEGLRQATGQPLRPVYHLAEAKTVLALDADFLLTETDAVANARGFAAGRKVEETDGEMSRLYMVEGALSLTGCNADHRIRLESRQIPAFLVALAGQLQARGLPLELPGSPASSLPEAVQAKLPLIAGDLLSSGPRSLILAGRRQPPEVHALACALNAALGAVGRTVLYYELRDTEWSNLAGLRELVEAIEAGEIATLLVLGGNPAYTAPADLDLPGALQKVEEVIQLGSRLDETSRFARWHLPLAHFLEAWGDARASDGSVSVIQPLIAPLFNSRSVLEVLGLLEGEEHRSGYELVRETWLDSVLGAEDFESRWERVLHDGILGGSALRPVEVALRSGVLQEALRAASREETSEGFELVFVPSSTLFDGRFANNGWLQELPDPVTKQTWGNSLWISPASARRLELRSGELVRLQVGEWSLEAPVLILPGQADGSLALALGYGREAAGLVGSGYGVNAYRLRPSTAPYTVAGVRVEKTGQRQNLALTQDHWEMEGRPIIREGTLEEYRARPDFARAVDPKVMSLPLWKEHEYREGYQWGMVIDLAACIGCNACVVACQSENNVPIVGKEQVERGREMQWLRVDRYFSGSPDDPRVSFQPVPCMHCENAPCEQVCPVAATVHDREGINAMVYNRCVGTRYCSNNCPYKVRRFNYFNYTKSLPELVQMAMNPDVTVRSRGVMEKCTYCIQRISEGKIRARLEGRDLQDGEIRTACQQTCPAQAIVFGNINDPQSRVVRLKEKNRNYVVLGELGNKPRTSYLAGLRNPHPEWPA